MSVNLSSRPRYQTWQQSDYRAEPSLSFPSNVRTFEEAVRWYINRWFKGIINELQNKVVNPVWKFKEDLRLGDQTKLASLCQDALKKIRNYIDNIDPNFWRSYEMGKVPMARGLYHVVEESFKPIYKEIDRLIKDLDSAVYLKKEELQRTRNAFKRFQKQVKKLETRLESLESPIGKIPVGLTDFVKVFPFLIVILMLMITTYLSKSKRLYTVLWKEIEKDSSKMEKMIFQNHIKPWFLPPYQNPVPLILLSIIILTLASIFFRSIFLIIKEPDLFISIIGQSESFIKAIFISAYTFGAFIIFVCIWIIQKHLRT